MSTFNLELYSAGVIAWIPDISEHDLKFVCNKASEIYKSLDDGCVDNFRISRVVDGDTSDEYDRAYRNGCCGSVDQIFTNPLTGNSFMIGFNYGH